MGMVMVVMIMMRMIVMMIMVIVIMMLKMLTWKSWALRLLQAVVSPRDLKFRPPLIVIGCVCCFQLHSVLSGCF